MSRVLITGGAGFIGRPLARQLVLGGHAVCVLDASRPSHQVDQDLRYIVADIRDAASVAEAFARSKPEIVIHLAAIHYIPYCNQHPQETIDVNVLGTRTVLEACMATSPASFFFASTGAIYAPSLSAHKEDEVPGPLDIYGTTKLAGERMVGAFHSITGVACTIGRLFNVYGPGDTNPHLIPELAIQLERQHGLRKIGFQLGNLQTERDYVFVSDVVSAIRTSAESASGLVTYNVGGGYTHSGTSLVNEIKSLLTVPISVTVDESRLRPSDRPVLRADNQKIVREIGWTPEVDIQDGLKATLDLSTAN